MPAWTGPFRSLWFWPLAVVLLVAGAGVLGGPSAGALALAGLALFGAGVLVGVSLTDPEPPRPQDSQEIEKALRRSRPKALRRQPRRPL